MPDYYPVEYDPFAPVPVDHDPWEGQPDPFAYQAQRVEFDPYEDQRQQAYAAWLKQAPQDEINDEMEAKLQRYDRANPPGYAEGTVMPPDPSRRAGYEAYAAEIEAARGQPGRDQDLREALQMRGYGSTIPTIEAQENSLYGQPISDRRALDLDYTPPITSEDRDNRSQYPLAGDVRPATPPEAWFENPPWLQSEPPPGWAQPYPSPSGLSGSYTGHGKLLGKQSPLRGTYRHTWEF